MCTLVLRIAEGGVEIGANRDEMLDRPWDPPAAYWPGITGGRDALGGGTWMGLNRQGVMAAVLNRTGTLGRLPGKRSRGELPLIALQSGTAEAAAQAIAALDAGAYRSFNLVTADATGAFFLASLESGSPIPRRLNPGTWMITSADPNDFLIPRIARHLQKFEAAAFADWPALLADNAPPAESAIDIPAHDGFGTSSSALLRLAPDGVTWRFAAGPPHAHAFQPVVLDAALDGNPG